MTRIFKKPRVIKCDEKKLKTKKTDLVKKIYIL